MNIKKSTFPQWILLPILFSSASVLAGGLGYESASVNGQAAALSADSDGFLDDVQQTSSAAMNYVGGNTRIGVGFDSDFKGRIDGSHIFSHSNDSATSGEGWIGINPQADEEKDEELITGAGARINHHWVSRDESGTPVHVNKVFGAYDQNEAEDKKVTAGYGQERESMFWSGHVSKSLSDERVSGATANHKHIYEKAYDYGVGGRVGTFMDGSLLRLQGGLDYEWGAEQADSEDLPAQLTVSGGVEKFFQDSPHSIGANVGISTKSGGYAGDEHEADVSGNVSYRYDFGNAGLFASDEQYRRVRVEIPGQTEVVKVRKQRAPTGTRQVIRNNMAMDANTFFHNGNHHLTSAGQQRLRTMLTRLRNGNYQGRIRIIGDACSCNDGAQQARNALAKRRAVAVRDFMIKSGFKANEMQAIGFHEAGGQFVSTGEDRVVIEYMAQGGRGQAGAQSMGAQAYDIEERRNVISKPRVVWRKELIQSGPAWVGQALRNNITYKQTIDTYRTLGVDALGGDGIAGGTNNTAPVAVDETVSTAFNTQVMIDVLSNDSDPDGDTVTILGNPETSNNGGTVINQDGKLLFTPAQGFSGQDSFTYTITDGNGAQANATVTINVGAAEPTPEPTPTAEPTPTPSPEPTPAPVELDAVDDSRTIKFNTSIAIGVLNNDAGAHGDVVTAFDATSANGGSVVSEDGLLVYTSPTDFSGTDTFTYTITDSDGNTDTATVTITVQEGDNEPEPVDEPPKADDLTVVDDGTQGELPGDTYSFYTNDAVTRNLGVLSNDHGDDLEIIAITVPPRFGTAVISSDGKSVNYTLRSGYCEDHFFVYRVRDKHGNEAEARVNINVLDDGKEIPASNSYSRW